MQISPVVLLVSGYFFILLVFILLVRNWVTVKSEQRGPRFVLLRKLNIAAITLSCLALVALITGFYIGGHVSIAGIPLLILLLGLSGFPKRNLKKS
jgi:hypothetical protein